MTLCTGNGRWRSEVSRRFGNRTAWANRDGLSTGRLKRRKDAKTYGELRYELMPYTYTYAHEASRTGMPIARAMMIEHQHDSLAWKYDLQYMWGNEILVAPNCSEDSSVAVWLPEGSMV